MKLERRNITTIINSCDSLFPPTKSFKTEKCPFEDERFDHDHPWIFSIFPLSRYRINFSFLFFFFFFRAELKKMAKGKRYLTCLFATILCFFFKGLKMSFFFFEDERFDHDVNIIVFHKLKRSYRLMIKGYMYAKRKLISHQLWSDIKILILFILFFFSYRSGKFFAFDNLRKNSRPHFYKV